MFGSVKFFRKRHNIFHDYNLTKLSMKSADFSLRRESHFVGIFVNIRGAIENYDRIDSQQV
uniref:Uncharacterized protein n=1 Tax=Arundo donax TaxID=35708 RepID=A0A0A9A7M7_ARUDO